MFQIGYPVLLYSRVLVPFITTVHATAHGLYASVNCLRVKVHDRCLGLKLKSENFRDSSSQMAQA